MLVPLCDMANHAPDKADAAGSTRVDGRRCDTANTSWKLRQDPVSEWDNERSQFPVNGAIHT